VRSCTTTLAIPGWGEAVLEASGRVVVYGSANNGSSVPLCDQEVGGTYELLLTRGAQKATWSGTWLRDAEGRLVLQ
jgi:hypothetical protein